MIKKYIDTELGIHADKTTPLFFSKLFKIANKYNPSLQNSLPSSFVYNTLVLVQIIIINSCKFLCSSIADTQE